jgi:hypothetical protein
LFNIRLCAHFDPQRLANQPLERRGVALGGPELEFGVARRPHLQQGVIAPVVQLETGDRLGMAAIERFRQAQQG